jgi:CBS domain-containing protein
LISFKFPKFAALELLVEHHVTGLPVIDEAGSVVGVVSDFDLLALEGVTTAEKAKGLFPEAGADWSSFFEVQKLVEKNKGKTVGDVMTSDPVCVRPATTIEDAANLLLRMKIRRLPVVDERGRLVGILTRSNIIKAAWEARQASRH